MENTSTNKPFKVWYNDKIGLTNTTIYSRDKKSAERYFDRYYKGYKLVGLVEQGRVN